VRHFRDFEVVTTTTYKMRVYSEDEHLDFDPTEWMKEINSPSYPIARECVESIVEEVVEISTPISRYGWE